VKERIRWAAPITSGWSTMSSIGRTPRELPDLNHRRLRLGRPHHPSDQRNGGRWREHDAQLRRADRVHTAGRSTPKSTNSRPNSNPGREVAS
jgi:hypothetical protein